MRVIQAAYRQHATKPRALPSSPPRPVALEYRRALQLDLPVVKVTSQESGAVTVNLSLRCKGRRREGVRGSQTPGLTPHPLRLDDPEAERALHPTHGRAPT